MTIIQNNDTDGNPSLADVALSYVSRFKGRRFIFPIKAGAKFPPLIRDNLNAASNDPEQIKRWAAKWPGCNWGLANKKSGTLVVDVDVKPGKVGQATYDGLDVEFGFPKTETVETPSGGRHYYYEGEHVFALGLSGFGQDIDSPNYVLIAGCQFKDGSSYSEPVILPTAPTEPWFYEVLGRDKKVRVENPDEVVVDLDTPSNIKWAQDHLRNDAPPSIEGQNGDQTTFNVAATLRDNGISETKAVELMNDIYNERCEPIWDLDDLIRKVANAYTYANQSKIGGRTAEADFADDDVEEVIASIKPSNPNAEAERAALKAGPEDVFLTRAQLCAEYVYITGAKLFVCRKPPAIDAEDRSRKRYGIEAFNKAFCYVTGSKGRRPLADQLLVETTNTIKRRFGLAYKPGQGEFVGEYYNLYVPSPVVPSLGNTEAEQAEAQAALARWNDHLEYLYPLAADRDLVLNWFAWLLQNLGEKPRHALLLQGRLQGTGKSFIGDMVSLIVGLNNVAAVTQNDLASNFNPYAMGAKLIVIEELRAIDKAEPKERLHSMISQERIAINDKNEKRFEMRNCFGILAMTNDDAAVYLEDSDRRYLVVRTDAVPRDNPDCGEGYDPDYYATLYAMLQQPVAVAAIASQLLDRDVGKYDGRAKAPMTQAKEDMMQAGAGDLESWMIENSGRWPLNARVVRIDDIILALPQRLDRGGRLAMQISSILKRKFKGVPPSTQTRVGSDKVRLWVLNDGLTGADANRPERLAAAYQEDKAAGCRTSPDALDANALDADDAVADAIAAFRENDDPTDGLLQ